MHLAGPNVDAVLECERVLRSLPAWFGVEQSLIEYAAATKRLPTFVVLQDDGVIAFASLERHFSRAWELHCIAVASAHRGTGFGRALLNRAEAWLREQGATVLQVKTLADSHPSTEYAETRRFYERCGFEPLEEFPGLWGPTLPVLLLVKVLSQPEATGRKSGLLGSGA